MEIFGIGLGLSVAAIAILATIATLLLPVAWVWMLIDSLVREEYEYPQATPTSNNRLVWALLIAFLQFPAIFYFFVVFGKVKRGTVVRPVWATPQVVYTPAA